MIRTVFITGASTGIGRSLSEAFAGPDTVIGIAARRFELLNELKKNLESRGARVICYQLDVTDQKACERAAKDFRKQAGDTDLVIANAGISVGQQSELYSTEKLTHVINVNVNGVIHTWNPFLPDMVKVKKGHLVVISSIAAYAPLPGGTYSASKIAVRYLADTLRHKLAGCGLHFTSIHPGFIDTPLTKKNRFPMPFLISSEKAAKKMKKAILRRKKVFIVPGIWRLVVVMLKITPQWILRRVGEKQTGKADCSGRVK